MRLEYGETTAIACRDVVNRALQAGLTRPKAGKAVMTKMERKKSNPQRKKSRIGLALAFVGIFMLTGCPGDGDKLDVAAVDAPLRALCDRHDKYVKADKSLPQVEKDIALRTTELVRKALDTAQKKNKAKPASGETALTDGLDAGDRLVEKYSR